jgi:hypothetical protein
MRNLPAAPQRARLKPSPVSACRRASICRLSNGMARSRAPSGVMTLSVNIISTERATAALIPVCTRSMLCTESRNLTDSGVLGNTPCFTSAEAKKSSRLTSSFESSHAFFKLVTYSSSDAFIRCNESSIRLYLHVG